MKKKQQKNKYLALLLYLLPILFFIISYFLITTSGEDIHQGAGNLRNGVEINAIDDMTNAFKHSGRITDMYAWSVIDLFDYQYQFGIDTIFRIIDVILISGSFYLATFIILGRKPKLVIKDALVFCSTFVAVIFSMFGRRLYTEFSMIHNYVPLVFITLLFSIPYLKLMLHHYITEKPLLLSCLMLMLGVIFGLSTTVTPLAFLATVVIYSIINRKNLPKFQVWFFTGLIGLIIGAAISLFLSSGIGDYTNNPIAAKNFDYISLADFLQAPFQTTPRLLFHLVYNFGMLLLPLLVYFLAAVYFTKSFRQVFTRHPFKNISPSTKHLIIAFSLFIFIHTFATIQIKTPPRILIPAYFAGIILIFKIFVPHIKSRLFAPTIIFLSVSAIILHTIFLSLYHTKANAILEEIKSSPEESLCIDWSRNVADRVPVINLSQEYLLVDWGYPEPIYDKSVTICKDN